MIGMVVVVAVLVAANGAAVAADNWEEEVVEGGDGITGNEVKSIRLLEN